MPAPPEFDAFMARFENLFQLWLHGEMDTRVVNEEIDRVYRQSRKHTPRQCPHGKTALTCSECWFDGFTERGEAI